ncbi:MAG: phosphatidate cytidylyltransferase [Rhodobiaceae bacterium]|nr:phosphatidate cytidylyltransferase [Rhodobiaceae bacterium]MCC0041304.1 phosphatidate cytidylyltransferase [Rhodobiaceae bacterium]
MQQPTPGNPPEAKNAPAGAGKTSDFRARLISAIVLLPLSIGALLTGQLPFAVFVAVASTLVIREWVRMVNVTQSVPAVVAGTAAVWLAMTAIFVNWTSLAFGVLAAGALIVAALVPLRRVWAGAGVFYAGLPALGLVHLRGLEHGLAAVIFILVAVWSTDIGAYLGGRAIGGPKLWPAVSPKKTWAGFFSGLVAAAVGCLIVVTVAGAAATYGAGISAALALAIVLSLVGQFGDLFESFMKRHYGVKDSGTLIPGHGGAMDRLDSIIFAASLAALLAIAAGLPRVFAPFSWSIS